MADERQAVPGTPGAGPPSAGAPGPARRGLHVRWSRVLPVAVSAGLSVGIAWNFEGWGILANARWPWLLLAAAVSLAVNVPGAALRLWLVLRFTGLPATYGSVLHLVRGLLAATFFAPSLSGHLLYGVGLGRVLKVDAFQAFECVGYDKGMSLVASGVLVAGGWALLPGGHPLAMPWIPWLGAAGVAALFLDRPLARLLARFPAVRDRSRVLLHPLPWHRKALLLVLAILNQASDTATALLALLALGLPADPLVVAGSMPVVMLLSYLPLAVSGLGVRENLLAVFLAGVATWDQAVAVGLVVDGVEYVLPALAGVTALPALLRAFGRR